MTFEDEISDAIEYLERANGNCDTDCRYCKYNNDCWSYKSRKMAIRSLEAWEKVREEIERIGGSEEKSVYKCQHPSYVRGLEKSLEIINKHLKGGVTE